jgi:hypothetical protein
MAQKVPEKKMPSTVVDVRMRRSLKVQEVVLHQCKAQSTITTNTWTCLAVSVWTHLGSSVFRSAESRSP